MTIVHFDEERYPLVSHLQTYLSEVEEDEMVVTDANEVALNPDTKCMLVYSIGQNSDTITCYYYAAKNL